MLKMTDVHVLSRCTALYGLLLCTLGAVLGDATGAAQPPAPSDTVAPAPTPLYRDDQGSQPYNLAFSPDGHHLATALARGGVRLYSITSGKAFRLDHQFRRIVSVVPGKPVSLSQSRPLPPALGVAFSDHAPASLAVSLQSGEVLVYSLARSGAPGSSGSYKALPSTPGRYASAVAFCPKKALVAVASEDGSVRAWDVTSLWSMVHPAVPRMDADWLLQHRQPVLNLAFSPDGTFLASASADKTVKIIKVTGDTTETTTLHGHRSRVVWLAFNPESSALVSVSSDAVMLWDLAQSPATATALHREAAPDSGALTVAFGNGIDGDPVVAVGYADGTLTLFDLTRHTDRTFRISAKAVSALQFSPDDTILAATSYDGQLRIWTVASLATPK